MGKLNFEPRKFISKVGILSHYPITSYRKNKTLYILLKLMMFSTTTGNCSFESCRYFHILCVCVCIYIPLYWLFNWASLCVRGGWGVRWSGGSCGTFHWVIWFSLPAFTQVISRDPGFFCFRALPVLP